MHPAQPRFARPGGVHNKYLSLFLFFLSGLLFSYEQCIIAFGIIPLCIVWSNICCKQRVKWLYRCYLPDGIDQSMVCIRGIQIIEHTISITQQKNCIFSHSTYIITSVLFWIYEIETKNTNTLSRKVIHSSQSSLLITTNYYLGLGVKALQLMRAKEICLHLPRY